MTIKMNLQDVKDRVKDDTLDLSLCELVQVPVKEIVTIRKVVNLDLSNNMLVSLPKNFTTLTQIVKLDLSRNMLTEIPESIGEMKRLKHLDLYANQISRLPLSMGELKNLRWLDLKENPLTPAVASVAGPCSDAKECQDCARNVVAYLANVKMQIEQETLRRLNEVPVNEVEKESTGKKEGKKKKKKHVDKDNKKNANTNGCELKKEDTHSKHEHNEKTVTASKFTSEEEKPNIQVVEVDNKGDNVCCRLLKWTVLWPLVLALLFSTFIAVFPMLDKERSIHFIEYINHTTGLDLKPYQKYSSDMLHHILDYLTVWVNCIFKVLNDTLERYTTDNTDDTKKEF